MISHPEIEGMLWQTIGLDPSSIGSAAIARALRARMESIAVASPDEYWRLLQRSPDEMQELIESVVVSETWFFRDKEPFSTLSHNVKHEWLPAHPNTALRILSVPCATGEEPYSIAMGLMDSGLSADRFRIDAMDISLRVLDHARRGVYGRNAFRGDDLNFRDRYFRRVENGHLISEIVRERVDFRQGNLLTYNFGSSEGFYDFIFCRNVLIYFDDDAQQRAVAALKRLLAAGGLIFVGHAEMPLLTSRGFACSDFPRAFACRKQSTVRQPSEERPRRMRKAPPKPAARQTPPAVKFHRLPAVPVNAVSPVEKKSELETASALADLGRLQEAAGMCIAHLREHPDSAQSHYLLGLTRDAAGDEQQAARHYRKALYLDPNHSESLAQLSFLLENQGDIAGARRLYARASRSHQSSKVKV